MTSIPQNQEHQIADLRARVIKLRRKIRLHIYLTTIGAFLSGPMVLIDAILLSKLMAIFIGLCFFVVCLASQSVFLKVLERTFKIHWIFNDPPNPSEPA